MTFFLWKSMGIPKAPGPLGQLPVTAVVSRERLPTVSQTPTARIGIPHLVKPVYNLSVRTPLCVNITHINQFLPVFGIRESNLLTVSRLKPLTPFRILFHPISKNPPETLHPNSSQQSHIANEASNSSRRESTARESEQDDLITRLRFIIEISLGFRIVVVGEIPIYSSR